MPIGPVQIESRTIRKNTVINEIILIKAPGFKFTIFSGTLLESGRLLEYFLFQIKLLQD